MSTNNISFYKYYMGDILMVWARLKCYYTNHRDIYLICGLTEKYDMKNDILM
jgi:hypothetical protein